MGSDDRCVVVLVRARELMRELRPPVWLVLQDVALDAEWRDGRLVASTSARLVAEHLRVDPGTAASALRALRQRGLVELGQATGADGRFGLASYTLHLPDGLEVLSPCTNPPDTDTPYTEQPDTVSTGADWWPVLSCPWDGDPEAGPRERADVDHPSATSAHEGPHLPAGLPTRSAPWSAPTDQVIGVEPSDTRVVGEPGRAASAPMSRRRKAAKSSPGQTAFDLGMDA